MSHALIDEPAAARNPRRREQVPVGRPVGGVAHPRGPEERHPVQPVLLDVVDAGDVARRVRRPVDRLRACELLGACAEPAHEAGGGRPVRCAAEPVDAVDHGRQRHRLGVGDHVRVPDEDVRAACPHRRRAREDLLPRPGEHREQRPPLDLGVPRRAVRVRPPLERGAARVRGVARGVGGARPREQVGAARRDGGHGRTAECEHGDGTTEHEATQHGGRSFRRPRTRPGVWGRAVVKAGRRAR